MSRGIARSGLREGAVQYRTLGARFAKWRAVIAIGDGLPSTVSILVNAHALARYAALCQEQDLVAQSAFLHRVKCASAAALGVYNTSTESQPAVA